MPPEANARSPTAISQKPDSHRPDSKNPDSHQPNSKKPNSKKPGMSKHSGLSLLSQVRCSKAHLSMLAEVRLRAILRTFRSLRILRPLWPFRTLGATLCSLGHIL